MNFFSASTQLSHPTCQIFGVTALLCNLISGPATAAQTTNPVKVRGPKHYAANRQHNEIRPAARRRRAGPAKAGGNVPLTLAKRDVPKHG
jgi:hypothetical protein